MKLKKLIEPTPESLDEIVELIKAGSPKTLENKEFEGFVSLLSKLEQFPKKEVPAFNSVAVKNRIFDQIYIPQEITLEKEQGWMTVLIQSLPRVLRVSGGILGGALIMISLTIGTAVAALQSVPGQAIYPLKKVVENIQLKLASNDDEEQANLQVKFTTNRIEELEKVLQQNKGELSDQNTQNLVVHTVQNLQRTTADAVSAANKSKSARSKVAILTKLVEQSALLKSASIESEGQVKIELEKALESNKISQEEAIKNIERAGLKVDAQPIVVDENIDANVVTGHGKLTAVTDNSVSIGTAKFTINKDTKYIGGDSKDLAIGTIVDIKGMVKDDKTFATEISFDIKKESTEPALTPKPEATP